MSSFILTGCASTIVPVGEWARPADLELHSESLAGIKVVVRCGQLDNKGEVREKSIRMCRQLKAVLSSIGAVIVDTDDTSASLTLWYLERGVSKSFVSGLSMIGFYFTFGLIPEISTTKSFAELRVTDAQGAILDRSPLQLEDIRISGWAALGAMVSRKKSLAEEGNDLGKLFYRHVQNKVYSYSRRMKFASTR